MNNKTFKRFAALMLAGTMVIGSSVMAFAADDVMTSDATADYEGDAVENDIMQVNFPTVTDGLYNYKADPNGLLKETGFANLDGGAGSADTASLEDGILFMQDTNVYGSKSKELDITSMSAVDVDVTVKAEVSGTYDGPVKFNTDKTKFNSGEKELYIAVVNNTVTSDPTSDAIKGVTADDAASITYTIKGVPENFEMKYDSGEYKYEEKSGKTEADYNKASFYLTGAINKDAEWTGVKTGGGLPNLTVTWSFAKHEDSDYPHLSTDSVSASNLVVALSDKVPSSVTVEKILFPTGAEVAAYTVANGKISFGSGFVNNNKGKVLTVKFTDGKEETITVK